MSNHEGSALITVGLLGVRDTDMVPFREILDTIAAQDFPSVELLICPDSDDESRIQELLETLYHLPPDRFLRTRVQPFFYHVGAAKAMEWIIRNAAGKFLIFHTLSETLYDIHVLSNYWSAFQGRGESLGLAHSRDEKNRPVLADSPGDGGLRRFDGRLPGRTVPMVGGRRADSPQWRDVLSDSGPAEDGSPPRRL